MKKVIRQLGMKRDINRRDFVSGTSIAIAAVIATTTCATAGSILRGRDNWPAASTVLRRPVLVWQQCSSI